MGLIIASGNRLGSEIAAGVLIFFLIVFVFYADNNYLRMLNLSFIMLLGGLLAVNLVISSADPLQYVTLFVGVMSCLFSIYDIWDDLISRRVNESDASMFAKMTHTSSRCWGVIWGIIAVASLAAAIYFNLLVGEDAGESITSFGDMATETQVVLWTVAAVVGISVLHTGFTRRCTFVCDCSPVVMIGNCCAS